VEAQVVERRRLDATARHNGRGAILGDGRGLAPIRSNRRTGGVRDAAPSGAGDD